MRSASIEKEYGAYQRGLCLGVACAECIRTSAAKNPRPTTLPRRCLCGVHLDFKRTDCIEFALPRRCLCGVHHGQARQGRTSVGFASALPVRSASSTPPRPAPPTLPLPRRCLCGVHREQYAESAGSAVLCLGVACAECICKSRQTTAHHFVAYAVSR